MLRMERRAASGIAGDAAQVDPGKTTLGRTRQAVRKRLANPRPDWSPREEASIMRGHTGLPHGRPLTLHGRQSPTAAAANTPSPPTSQPSTTGLQESRLRENYKLSGIRTVTLILTVRTSVNYTHITPPPRHRPPQLQTQQRARPHHHFLRPPPRIHAYNHARAPVFCA